MKPEEIEAEIIRLKTELQQVNDAIEDCIRDLPEAKKADRQEEEERAEYGWPADMIPPPVEEKTLREALSKYRQKRDDLQARLEETKSQKRPYKNWTRKHPERANPLNQEPH